MIVSPMPVGKDDFLAPVARHFIRSFLEQLKLQMPAVSHCPRLVSSLEHLPEVIIGIHHRILLLRGTQSGVAYIDEIVA